jgi:alcohol dehydrogenase
VWTFSNPVRIVFGEGSFDELPTHIAGRGYLLVTYPDQFTQGLRRRLAATAGEPLLVIDDVAPNPDFVSLARQVERLGKLDVLPQVIVALGGGSVMDSAKTFAAAGGDFDTVATFLETKSGAERLSSIPIIAVPTTAGTGSEVTSWATIWHTGEQAKYSLALPSLYPETAIVDPALMIGKPRELTVATGLDALSHALESIWNTNATPISRLYATAAAKEIMDVLPDLVDDLRNTRLRGRMARAALLAGLAFSGTKTAIAHSISYPVTLRYDVPHGIACSFTLPMVMRSLDDVDGICAQGLGAIFEGGLWDGADRLERFLRQLGVSTDPASYGLSGSEWEALVGSALDGERGQNFIGSREALMAVMLGSDAKSPIVPVP